MVRIANRLRAGWAADPPSELKSEANEAEAATLATGHATICHMFEVSRSRGGDARKASARPKRSRRKRLQYEEASCQSKLEAKVGFSESFLCARGDVVLSLAALGCSLALLRLGDAWQNRALRASTILRVKLAPRLLLRTGADLQQRSQSNGAA